MRTKKPKSTRTVLEFLWKLPEPQQSKAIKNTPENIQYKDFIGRTIKDALMTAFVWNDSPEGGDYWNDFVNDKLL